MIKAIKSNAAKKRIPISSDAFTTKLRKPLRRSDFDGATIGARIIV